MTKIIKWNKGQWTHKGWFNYRLDRTSKCGKWIIHKWENERSYFISYLVEYKEYDDAFLPLGDHAGLKLFSTLKKAKEYLNQRGE